MRRLIARFEIGIGGALLALCFSYGGWCAWSLPRYGRQTPHGIETPMCNWGMEIVAIGAAGIALITMMSGFLGYAYHSKALGWYSTQVPAALVWAWVTCALVNSVGNP